MFQSGVAAPPAWGVFHHLFRWWRLLLLVMPRMIQSGASAAARPRMIQSGGGSSCCLFLPGCSTPGCQNSLLPPLLLWGFGCFFLIGLHLILVLPRIIQSGASAATCSWMIQSRGRRLLLLVPPRTIQSGASGLLGGLVRVSAPLSHLGLLLFPASLLHHGFVPITVALHRLGLVLISTSVYLHASFLMHGGCPPGEHYSKRPNHGKERSWRVQSKKKYIQQIVYEPVPVYLGTDQEHLCAVHCPDWHQRSDDYLNTPLGGGPE